jgi:hypothetical protein
MRRLPAILAITVVVGLAAIYYSGYIPDLSEADGAGLISRAPEFNRYARLIKVENIFHYKHSMDSMSEGTFLFRYWNATAEAPPIKAKADFRYWDGSWHLNTFDYGCPSDCHSVQVDNGPTKRQ